MSNPTPLTANPYGPLVIAKIDNLFWNSNEFQTVFKSWTDLNRTYSG